MRTSQLFRAAAFLAGAMLICSCEQQYGQKDTAAWNIARGAAGEIQIRVFDGRITNASSFSEDVRCLLASSNSDFRGLRSESERFWLNTNFDAWVQSVTVNGRPPNAISIASEYRNGDSLRIL